MELQKHVNKKTDEHSSVFTVFWILLGTFVFILGMFFVPAIRDLFRGSILFLLPLILFSLLGAVLIILTIRKKVVGRLKKFLIVTGASATGCFISIFLHNMIYGLFIYCFGEDFWTNIGFGDEPFFFIITIFVCPVAFLIGTVGTIYCLLKKKEDQKNTSSEE